MNKVKFSLKFKILSGIFFLLLVCTSFNLIYSYKLFIDDKTSYIYENGLRRVDNISDQLKFKFDEIKAKSHFNSILTSKIDLDQNAFFSDNKDLVFYGQAEFVGDQFKIISHQQNGINFKDLEKTLKVKEDLIFKYIEMNYSLSKRNQAEDVWPFRVLNSPPMAFSYYRTSEKGPFFFSIIILKDLFELFANDNIYKNKIIFLNNINDRKANQNFLQELNVSSVKSGTITFEQNNAEFLVSYVFLNKNILITSSIDKIKAFGISKFLIIKTVLFAGFLLGIAISIGIYFSSTLTTPIKTLTDKARRYAEGNFDDTIAINTSDEVRILGDTFNWMGHEIRELLSNKEQLIAKLEDYSKNLEKMVEQRTIELKTANDFMALMVNSLDQGLLVFDRDLKCHSIHTKACEPIFGVDPTSKSILDILGKTDEAEQKQITQWAQIVFNEMIPFESAVGLGPRQKMTGVDFNDPNFKYVQIDYYPMRNEDESIENIVMVATDKTLEVQAVEKASENEKHVSMILKIINNKPQFQSFIHEVDEIFEQFANVYNVQNETIEFDQAMILFHTLNGGFGMYNISKLQLMARGFESEISSLKDNCPNVGEYISSLIDHIEKLKNEFNEFKISLDDMIGTKFASGVNFVEVPKEKILELKPLVLSTQNQNLIDNYLENFVKEPVINFFKGYDDLCKSIALKIDKNFPGIKFYNEQIKIEAENYKEFFNVLVHVFRNCMDHGLEDPYTRESHGKSPEGHIGVSFEIFPLPDVQLLNITIQDDGNGIDPDRIRSKYASLNPDADLSGISNKEIIYKIFDPFFSTRDEVSFLSGRGVGMSAVKESIEKLGGTIEVESHIGKGTVFTFSIPMKA